MIRGRDVSHFQGTVNWKSLKALDGLSFGMAKCTQGTSFVDSQYDANRAGCRAAGLPFIAYHYAEPGSSSALAQVRAFVAQAGQVDGYCLDLEKSTLSQSATNAWMRAFGDDLRAIVSGTTFVYLGGYAANGSGQGSVDHFDHWIYPHYTVNSWPSTYTPRVGGNTTGWTVPPAPAIWQCSDNIRGMDALVSNLTLAQLFSGEDMPTADEIAQAVWSYNLPTYYPNGATTYALIGQAAKADDALLAVSKLPTVEQIAEAVAAALPSGSGGGGTGPTAAEIADAVVAKFSTLLGGTA